jgi:tetratricopeptide (TPR) repeat protein
MATDAASPNLQRAFELVRRGERLVAEEQLVAAVKNAEAKHGRSTPEHAACVFDLASLLLAIGDLRRATDSMREACEMKPRDAESEKDRLTYLMNLGEMLQRLGEVDEAQQVLERGLAERERFYGTEHPGVAYGLEPLADLCLLRGDLASAQRHVERARAILWQAAHPRIAQVMALAAEVTNRISSNVDPFAGAEHLPENVFDEMVTAVVDRAQHTNDPAAFTKLLDVLIARVEDERGDESPLMPHVFAAQANTARTSGDHEARIRACDALLDWLDDAQDHLQAIDATLALALAFSDAGRHDDAKEAYEEAAERARTLRDPLKEAQVLRNYAVYVAHGSDPASADRIFRQAASVAVAAKSNEAVGRTLVAYGIYQQHQNRLEEAKTMLEDALALLEPSHPDTLYARSHLSAIVEKKSCGCGDMTGALSEALRAMAMPHLPEGLLTHLAASFAADGGFKLDVQLAREPTPEELEHLNRVLQQAVAELQGRIRTSGHSG